MNEITLNCQGLACPQPVIRCKETISQSKPNSLIVQVDNEPAKENVIRFLTSQGYHIQEVREKNDIFELMAAHADQGSSLGNEPAPEAQAHRLEDPKSRADDKLAHLVFITSNVIGHGDDELGQKLMLNFMATLPEIGPSLWRILLLNSGVKLAVGGSPALEHLQKLEQNGVSILVCGTCLDFFNLLDQKQVGQTTNMLDVVTSLQLADKVIKV
ncbi:MAG: sulfurtransferase-like selenium metabolism protein YedF [Desulfovermiculus sp.]|nr:sulfurtransferase-like selenium metabolism protein YedF [Desulfovermiculus sp.]